MNFKNGATEYYTWSLDNGGTPYKNCCNFDSSHALYSVGYACPITMTIDYPSLKNHFPVNMMNK